MNVSPLAGKPAPRDILVNVPRLITAYYKEVPDPAVASQRVAFGTSGHRGSAFDAAFNEWHILAITQGICEYRKNKERTVLCFSVWTHMPCLFRRSSARSKCSPRNGVDVMLSEKDEYTPTPAISHAILTYNRKPQERTGGRNRHHTVAQSSGKRRIQIQPDQWRPGRYDRHRLDRKRARTN